MSERRRARAAGRRPGELDEVPAVLCRFSIEEWGSPEDTDPMMDPHRRWRRAREEWAQAHGYDLDARYGEAPGRDWWAFVAACQ